MTTPSAATPLYPIARPTSGDDARFCLELAYDITQVVAGYGYPPITTSADLRRLQQALFTFIYQHKGHPL